MRLRSKLLPCLLALATAAASLPAAAAPRIGFWAGQSITPCFSAEVTSCPRDLSSYTPQLWSSLRSNNGFLNLALVYGSDFGPTLPGVPRRTDGLALLQQANAEGVSVNAWILMPISMGSFANEENALKVQNAVKAFAAWKTANNLQIGEVTLDLEFPLGTQALQEALQGNQTTIRNLMQLGLNPAGQCAAMATYRDTISWAHQNGLRLTSSPIMFAIDDLANGTLALQDGLNMVSFPPFGYDALYLQAYRALGLDLGSGFVAAYFREMQQRLGARGQVTLGNTGMPPYNTAAALVADVRMLAALGATTIPVFDLDNAVKSYGIAGIQQIFDAAQNPMNATELAAAQQMSPAGNAARALFQALDNFATAATPWVTAAAWNPQVPNSSPNGCGNMTAQ